MNPDEFKEFMDAQIEEAKKFKAAQEKKYGKELGNEPIYQWIQLYSEDFRKKWEKKFKNKDGINGKESK